VAGSAGHSLVLQRVTHRFGDNIAANDVSLDIAAGELISLLGPSGCGKSTLLKIIAGFLRPSSGEVLVDGAAISHLPANRRQIGIVFQNYALFPHMTVAENIAYGPAAAGRSRADAANIVAEMLDVVQMAEFRERLPRELSGGQQQRVALARCLAIRPRILLLDEPFSALDKNLRLDMQIEIKRLQRRSGITTVLVTHDQEEALSLSDRIAVLSRGRVEQFAAPAEIYDRPASLFVNTFVGAANLIRAVLIGKTSNGSAVRFSSGEIVETPIAPAIALGAAVLVSVRPEGVRLSLRHEPGTMPARVTAAMPIGPSMIYEVALGDGASIRIVEDRGDRDSAAVGLDVFVRLEPKRISGLFPDPSPRPHKE
jgi:putative spermidine/putrescine transport system ATP-binding protein